MYKKPAACPWALRGSRCYLSLACTIGSMSLACGSLFQIPNTTDRISLQRGFFLTSLGFIYFVSLTDFCNKYLLETHGGLKFCKKYRLMVSDVLDITNKIVSAIQAFFSFLVGFIVCKSTCSKSFVYASHFLMEAYGWFGTAYFMYDIWAMYKVHTQKIADKLNLMRQTSKANGSPSSGTPKSHSNGANGGSYYDKHNSQGANGKSASADSDDFQHARHHEDEICDYDGECVQVPMDGKWDFLRYLMTHPIMIIHHVFIGTFGLLVVTYIRGGGHCIYSYMYMMEFSTPFVSLRGILSTLGLKDTRAYVINGLTMLASFLVCRVLMWPYVMWRYSVAIDATFWQAMTGLPTGCIVSVMILFLPQIYWFFLMSKGAIKVLFPSNTKALSTTSADKSQKQSKNNNLSPTTAGNSEEFYNGETCASSHNKETKSTDFQTSTRPFAFDALKPPISNSNGKN